MNNNRTKEEKNEKGYIAVIIVIFFCGLSWQCLVANSEPQPIPAYSGSPPVFLGGLWTRCVQYWASLDSDLALLPRVLAFKVHSCPQSPQPLLWEHSLSIHIFHRFKVYQATYKGLICCSCGCMERFPFLFFCHTTHGVQLLFCPASTCWPPSGISSPPRQEGAKAAAD